VGPRNETAGNVTTLTVDPGLGFRAHYYTYVLRGFVEVLGDPRVRFAKLDVPEAADPREGCALLVDDGKDEKRIFVSAGDRSDVDDDLLQWAHAYGKVNLAFQQPHHPRLHAIGPIFSVQLWRPLHRYLVALRMWRAGSALSTSIKQVHFQGRGRATLDAYRPRASDPNYVFFASRHWAPKHPEPDAPRERFISAANAVSGVRFDGGLLEQRMPHNEYLRRTARSAVAFNSPAVHDCLGWKLGEYLALGKAIISAPISRQLPVPLLHGEHLHLVADDEPAMSAAVELLTTDHEYRRHLETGARQWYERHLRPSVVATRLLGSRQSDPGGSASGPASGDARA
jgi:glycosyltransferase involved in cell wall biosynthesis